MTHLYTTPQARKKLQQYVDTLRTSAITTSSEKTTSSLWWFPFIHLDNFKLPFRRDVLHSPATRDQAILIAPMVKIKVMSRESLVHTEICKVRELTMTTLLRDFSFPLYRFKNLFHFRNNNMRKMSSSKEKWNEKNGLDRFPFNITSHFQPEIFYEWKGGKENRTTKLLM